jgi:hypothetical protein
MSLKVNIGKFKGKFGNKVGAFKRGVMISLFKAVIRDTPVGTSDPKRSYTGGRLRGAWIFSTDAPRLEKRVNFADPTERVVSGVQSQVDEKDGKVFLSNPMEYAARIEYDGHSHTKAPEGMVRKNLVRVVAKLEARAAE